MTIVLRSARGVLVCLLALGAALAFSRAAPSAQAPPAAVVAIRGGTVLTVTRGTIANGVVVLRDGRLAAVGGPGTNIPAGAEVVDATGRFVSPGIIDAHSHIATDAINEGGTTVSSMTGIEDVADPTDVNIYRDLAGGLTVANVLHGSANPIGGKNRVIKLRWGKTKASELVFEGAPPGIKFALGENPKDMRQFGQTGPRRYPVTRPGVEFVIRDAFTRAKAYQRSWQDFERRRKAGEDGLAPRRDLQLDPLVEILEGKRLVHAHSYRADEILMLLRLADELGFKVATLQHVLEGYKVADEIAAHGAGASTFSDWWGYKIEAEDAIPYNAALMHRRGVLVSINSDSAEHARRLNTEAAKSIKWGGLTEDEALALVTINPAKQLRVDARVGSLEQGKDADVVIWSHHPLNTFATAERVYIDGTLYYDKQADLARAAEVDKEKAALTAAEGRKPTTTEPMTSPRPQSASLPPGVDEGLGGVDEQAIAAARQSTGAGGLVAIVNARIHPIAQPTIERGTLVMRAGRIEAVGASAAPPADATIIDAKGAEVYPGFIDARSTMGLVEPGAGGFADTAEMLEVNAGVRANVAYQADSDGIPVARVNGITSVAVVPNGGLVGGQVSVMNLDGWTWEEATVKPFAALSMQFPSIGRAGGFGGPSPEENRKYEELKKERDARLTAFEDQLAAARAYAKTPTVDRRTDWTLEALAPVATGQLPLYAQANSEAQIRDAVAFADRTGVKLVITGGLESPRIAALLKEKNIPVVLGSVFTTPTREDDHHAATYRAAGALAAAGVTFAFGSGGYSNTRLIPYEAAISVAWGLPREQAVRALTLDAARILGVSDRLGSLEVGKAANLFVASGDPLDLRTNVTHVFINGREVGPDNKHLGLYQRFSSRPATAKRGAR